MPLHGPKLLRTETDSTVTENTLSSPAACQSGHNEKYILPKQPVNRADRFQLANTWFNLFIINLLWIICPSCKELIRNIFSYHFLEYAGTRWHLVESFV